MIRRMMFLAALFALALTFPSIASEDLFNEGITLNTEDKGVEVVTEAIVPVKDIPKNLRLSKQVNAWLQRKRLQLNYNEKIGTIIQWHMVQSPAINPANDPFFIEERDTAYFTAQLIAKGKIADFLGTKAEGIAELEIFMLRNSNNGGEVVDKFDQINDADANINEALGAINQAIADLEMEQETGPSITRRLQELGNTAIDALIKKLDSNYSEDDLMAAMESELQTLREKKKAMVDAQRKNQEELHNVFAASKQTLIQSMETNAAAYLAGTTTIKSFEQWDKDTGLYTVAVVVAWSPRLNDLALAVLSGKDPGSAVARSSTKAKTLEEVVDSFDLSTDMGTRTAWTADGMQHLFAFGCAPVLDNNESESLIEARLSAKDNLFYALESNIMYKEYRRKSQELAKVGKGYGSKMAKEVGLTAESSYNIEISGAGEKRSEIVTHEQSGQEMAVVVFHVSGDNLDEIQKVKDKNFLVELEKIKQLERLEGERRDKEAMRRKAAAEGRAESRRKSGENIEKWSDQMDDVDRKRESTPTPSTTRSDEPKESKAVRTESTDQDVDDL